MTEGLRIWDREFPQRRTDTAVVMLCCSTHWWRDSSYTIRHLSWLCCFSSFDRHLNRL
jgi:hypothetical protein